MKYEEFIGKVRQRARLATPGDAEKAVAATFAVLATRLKGREVEQLGAQLPPKLLQYLRVPEEAAGESFGAEEFFRCVSVREGIEVPEAEYHVRVVLALLAEVITMGEVEDIKAQLPPDLAKLFDVENEGDIPELGTITDVEQENS